MWLTLVGEIIPEVYDTLQGIVPACAFFRGMFTIYINEMILICRSRSSEAGGHGGVIFGVGIDALG